MLLNDYRQSPYMNPLFVHYLGTTAVLAEPLICRDRLHGVVSLNNNRTGRKCTTQDREIIRLFAAQAAIAVENARLYEALEVRLSRLQTLTRLNQLVSSSLDLDYVLPEIAPAAATLMRAAVVSFWFVNEMTHSFETCTFSGATMDAAVLTRQPSYDHDGIDWVVIHRRSLNIPDVFTDARFVALDWWRTHDLRSFLAVPVLYNDVLLAVLVLNGQQPFSLQADTQEILDSFVSQAAIALNNARLFAEVKTQTAQLEQANAVLHGEIRERQRAETALRQARDELESRVEARTAELRQANV
jgi:GAF domain-containing protein